MAPAIVTLTEPALDYLHPGQRRLIARSESTVVWTLRHQNPVFNRLLNHLELEAANVACPDTDQEFMAGLDAACQMLTCDHLLGAALLARYPLV